ncbi:unnamed protein product [Notodromas monacha]|uniref:Uncharacterized protein n=1 Tax=Notodromas monacha TaxID=399045 RepID=A0A7R9BNY7_9CRUS|nr:unnamed protein product [Notodromas monacha]CAG0919020.1 unnamed protein product [Notodromas monacha]
MSLRLCQFLAVGLALLLVVDFRSSSAAPADVYVASNYQVLEFASHFVFTFPEARQRTLRFYYAKMNSEFTYENVRDAAVENVKNMTQPLDFEIGIIDNLIKVVDEAGKFMESLPADQHKAMVLCLHEVAIQEPLRAEKKGLQMASRLACEVKSKMLNQPADKCV